MPSCLPAAEIEPVSRIASSRSALPGPIAISSSSITRTWVRMRAPRGEDLELAVALRGMALSVQQDRARCSKTAILSGLQHDRFSACKQYQQHNAGTAVAAMLAGDRCGALR